MGFGRFSATQRIIAAVMLNGLFSLVAMAYALASMSSQNTEIERVVNDDFRAMMLARDLRDNMVSQERLDKQHEILGDPEILEVLDRREQEFDELWVTFLEVANGTDTADVRAAVQEYQRVRDSLKGQGNGVLSARPPRASPSPSALSAPRERVISNMYEFWIWRNVVIGAAMRDLSQQSQSAFRWTFILMAIGVALGTPIAASVVLSIHKSVRRLMQATEQVGAGTFNVQLEGEGPDEFGDLSRAFVDMGRKLRELERRLLDAHPLTRLPGNLAIEHDIDSRVERVEGFAHAYIDLDNFKAYNDHYGYQRGNDIIARTADILREAVTANGDERAFVGHIGGDDFVLLCSPAEAEPLAKDIIARFDADVPNFYNEEDRTAGFITARDRFGVERKYPLMSVSIAITMSESIAMPTAAGLGKEAARIKEHLKAMPGSNYLIDRRRGRT